jgi:hypothetical protein|tara:strand:- start:2475 stop:3065 length:591 start_codon:yes stop_codon:yes gene_type:complete
LRPTLLILIFFLFPFCSTVDTYEYELKVDSDEKITDGVLIFNIIQNSLNSESIKLNFQFFPKYEINIESYVLTFDMKFRENYESNFDGICIGPTWNGDKPGEFEVILSKENNFKSKIIGKYEADSLEDRCTNYFFYLRYFEANLYSNQRILYGVATDYADNYPDAPNYWIVNENNEIEKIGNSNINKYSIYFELSK